VCFAAGGLAAVALSASQAPAADANLAGEWHLDEIVTQNEASFTPDGSGNGLTGRVEGAEPAPGRFGNALVFRGSGSVLVREPGSVLRPARVTVVAWVKNRGIPGYYTYIVGQGARDCAAASYALYTGDGGLDFYVDDGANVHLSPRAAPDQVWDGQWHAVAGSFDGKTVRLYVDGRQVGEGTSAPVSIGYAAADESENFEIGYYAGGGACSPSGFVGLIDEVRVYSRALSADEIAYLAGSGTSPRELPGPPSTTTTTPPSTTPPSTTTSPPPPPTTTTTSTTGPHATTTPPSVARMTIGVSKTLKNGIWLSAKTTSVPAGVFIGEYQWDLNGDRKWDWTCGRASPAMSAALRSFAGGGRRTLGLRVVDSLGRASTVRQTLVVPRSVAAGRVGGDVFDCENPAAGNQPDVKGCIRSFGFGIVAVSSRGRSSDCFELTGYLNEGATKAKTRVPAAAGLKQPPLRWYRATIHGPVALNGLYAPVPESATSTYDQRDGSVGLGSVELQVGSLKLPRIPIDVKVEPDSRGRFNLLPAVDVPDAARKVIAGMPLKSVKIDLIRQASETSVELQLPNVFTFGEGAPAQGRSVLRATNEHGIELNGIRLGPIPLLYLGPLEVHDLFFDYDKSKNAWSGGGKLQLFAGSPVALDAAPPPPDNGIGLVDGRFDHGGFGLAFLHPPYPEVFPGVGLKSITVAIGVNPTRFSGKIAAALLQGVVEADGEAFVAFPTPRTPYVVPDEGLGPSLEPLKGRTLDSTSLAIGGDMKLKVPVIGTVPLLKSYVFYAYPDYFELGGGFDYGNDYFQVKGGVSGFLAASPRTFNLEGGLDVCVKKIISFCKGVGTLVSSKGIAFCTVVPIPTPFGPVPAPAGVGYRWGDSVPDVMIFDCDIGPYREARPESSPRLRAMRGAPAATSFTLPPGLPSAMVRATGNGDAPKVTLTGPKGERITTPDGTDPSASRTFYVVRIPETRTTLVALRTPAAGSWTVTTQPGSAPVTRIAVADGLRPPTVRARVDGHGSARVLSYEIRDGSGRQVTFAERGKRTFRILGTTHSARGTIRFSPAAGAAGQRQILALLERNGVPARAIVVARYSVSAAPRLGRPAHLRVTHRGSTLLAAWRSIPGALRYRVRLDLTSGQRTLRVVRASSARFAGIPATVGGTVSVVAIRPDGAAGAEAHASIPHTRSSGRR
jgi:hypothetical protein